MIGATIAASLRYLTLVLVFAVGHDNLLDLLSWWRQFQRFSFDCSHYVGSYSRDQGLNVGIAPATKCIHWNHAYRHSIVMAHTCHGTLPFRAPTPSLVNVLQMWTFVLVLEMSKWLDSHSQHPAPSFLSFFGCGIKQHHPCHLPLATLCSIFTTPYGSSSLGCPLALPVIMVVIHSWLLTDKHCHLASITPKPHCLQG